MQKLKHLQHNKIRHNINLTTAKADEALLWSTKATVTSKESHEIKLNNNNNNKLTNQQRNLRTTIDQNFNIKRSMINVTNATIKTLANATLGPTCKPNKNYIQPM